jgi:alpha-acetolactate decarboxylase
MASNALFQYSVVTALMDGVASNGLPLHSLLQYGDHGLGTFRYMGGEMIIIDGQIYSMRSNGSVSLISPSEQTDTITPYAMVTRFSPTVTKEVKLGGKDELEAFLTNLMPRTRNNYLAFRIDGVFKSVTVRAAGPQKEKGEGLVAVCARQTVFELEPEEGGGIKGTIIGFRSPAFLQGVSVAGDHLHFITKDRKRGGHMLGFETEGKVEVQVAGMWKVELEFPKDDEEFDQAKLKGDDEGIKAVEG